MWKQGVTRGYKGLQKVTGGYKGLQKVTEGYKGLQGVEGGYEGLGISQLQIEEDKIMDPVNFSNRLNSHFSKIGTSTIAIFYNERNIFQIH